MLLKKIKGRKFMTMKFTLLIFLWLCLGCAVTKETWWSGVDITRDKFMEVKGASKQPDAIEKLSVQCNILQLVFSWPSEARFLCVYFRVSELPIWQCQNIWEIFVETLTKTPLFLREKSIPSRENLEILFILVIWHNHMPELNKTGFQ